MPGIEGNLGALGLIEEIKCPCGCRGLMGLEQAYPIVMWSYVAYMWFISGGKTHSCQSHRIDKHRVDK